MASVADEVSALARIRGRRLFIEDRRRFDDRVSRLDDRYDYEIAVRRCYATRSIQANRFYWKVIVGAISEHTGYTPDEVHEFLKAKFLPKRLAMCDGNGVIVDEFVIGGSTRKLKTDEFNDYCRSCGR